MKTLQLIIIVIGLSFLFVNTAIAGNNTGRSNGIATPEVVKESGNKKLKGVMIFDKAPVMDKDICELELNFDIIIEGNTIELFNKSIGDYTNVEIVYGDGEVGNDFDHKHQYSNAGTHYIAVSLFDKHSGCLDFVGLNVFVGEDGSSRVVLNSADLVSGSVANL